MSEESEFSDVATAAIPPLVKKAIGGALIAVFGGAVGISAAGDPPPESRIQQLIANDARQDTILGQLQPKANYLFCVDLADRQLIGKTPQDCFQEFVNAGSRP